MPARATTTACSTAPARTTATPSSRRGAGVSLSRVGPTRARWAVCRVSEERLPAVQLDLDLGEFQAEWDAVVQEAAEEAEEDGPDVTVVRGRQDVEWLDEDNGRKLRAYLVGAEIKTLKKRGKSRPEGSFNLEDSLLELEQLADTAGLLVVGQTTQRMAAPSARTYVGSGKVDEMAADCKRLDVDMVIFDDELSASQGRNIERILDAYCPGGVRVLDRTNLIIDIFSQRANSKEGKLQVELAMAEYQLPRLTRMWSHLERQAGGGQSKGMGETQMEVDKRLLRERIGALKTELESVRVHRAQYRTRRAKVPLPTVAIVGYTNAGKSTLLNRLTDAGVLAEDKLFATLDPTTRRIALPNGKEVLLTDTVGFIQKLPTHLVSAFRATLEEIAEASVLLQLVDVSSPRAVQESEAVRNVLKELGLSDLPVITVWNKMDAAATPDILRQVAATCRDTFCISSLSGDGVTELLAGLEALLQRTMIDMDVLIPYTEGALLGELHTTGVISDEEFLAEGTRVRVHLPYSVASKVETMAAANHRIIIYEGANVLGREDFGEQQADDGGLRTALGVDEDDDEDDADEDEENES